MVAGQRYGLRVDGPWDPGAGHRHDPAKLLLDPYARALEGELRWGPEVFAHAVEGPQWLPVDGGSVQATLARSPAAAQTLAALTDPSACRPTTLRVQAPGTQLALASFTAPGGLDAYTAWDCGATVAPHGYSVSTDGARSATNAGSSGT